MQFLWSHSQEYKMCVRIDENGFGSSKVITYIQSIVLAIHAGDREYSLTI